MQILPWSSRQPYSQTERRNWLVVNLFLGVLCCSISVPKLVSYKMSGKHPEIESRSLALMLTIQAHALKGLVSEVARLSVGALARTRVKNCPVYIVTRELGSSPSQRMRG